MINPFTPAVAGTSITCPIWIPLPRS